MNLNWNVYSQILDNKISEAWYNMQQDEKKAKASKAIYESTMREKKIFDENIHILMGKVDTI